MATSKKRKMKTYLAVYLGTTAAMKRYEKLPAKTRREREAQGLEAWHEWARKNARSLLDMGAPLGTTKRVDKKGIRTVQNQLTAYTVVRAPSHAAAAKLFRNHPHFTIFPGDSVEIMECLSIPGM